uniref:Clusterinassociated protein 1 putative n=1 Tax=Albugo laibachii Nc14 TaxID=890382 RepID=F0WPH9_9STRA|nr:clusterinassociated protein 1 putative [Albugo laibachii Nc14]|eukprot:CCA23227.1 clusterinassociated protein 1 putative [Albugo laibachii Nc14]
MSYRELRNLAEMMRSLGYPRPISVENFRTPNFELVSDLLYWMVKKYDPASNVTGEIDTEEDRVEFVTQVASEVLLKARIRLNPKKLYAADGFAVKELIRLADTLYRASRISTATSEGVYDDEDDVSIKSVVASRVRDPKATRQLSHDLMQSGVKLYDLLEAELEIRNARQSALRFLDALGNSGDDSIEERHLERSVKEIVSDTQKTAEMTERQAIELEAEEKALTAKIKKAQVDLERSEKRLRSLQNVRPAFMDEYEKLEKELEHQYAIYCERFRNLDYLQRELDLHNAREMKRLAENDRSLKKLQKKFRDDELAILRGEQEDPLENSLADNNNNDDIPSPKSVRATTKTVKSKENSRTSPALLSNPNLGSRQDQAGHASRVGPGAQARSGMKGQPRHSRQQEKECEEDESESGDDSRSSGDDEDFSSEGTGEDDRDDEQSVSTILDSEEVSLADSVNSLDQDEEFGSGEDQDESQSEQSGSRAEYDSDQNF